MRALITGGCGFLGHHMVEHVLKNTDWDVVVLDRLSYASSGFDRLRDIDVFDDSRVLVLASDFTRPISEGVKQETIDVDYIIHMGAETHVDNSITDARPFVMSNVVGTLEMLELARTMPNLKWFNYFSTDEVFGPAPEGTEYKEWDRYDSTNPYSASKAGGEEMVLAYANTHKVPCFITHTMNLIGERQHYEKYVPLVIRKVLQNETVYIHSNSEKTKAGSRFYLHARNAAAAVLFLLENAKQREKYNVVGEIELDNLQLAEMIADIVGKPLEYELVDFHSSRPGHDLRYALDGTRMKEMGFTAPVPFLESLEKTVRWFMGNPKWLGYND
jgi:dTDP-glucose 4,6-dehydratase